MSKLALFSKEAQVTLISGVDKLSKLVSVTMGPKGRNVIIGKPVGAPVITKDGATVARETVLSDPIENLACDLVKEVAGRTAVIAGDGTTTATVLSDEILQRGSAVLSEGYSPVDFRDGINWACERISEILEKNSLQNPSEQDIINIATVSTNNDNELGLSIGSAYNWAGEDGTVGAEAYPGIKTSFSKIDGVSLNSGYLSPSFLNAAKESEVVLEDCKVIIADEKINDVTKYLDLLNNIKQQNFSVLVISRGLSNEVLKSLVENSKRNILKVCSIMMPEEIDSQEALDDLSILLGGSVFGRKFGNSPDSSSIEELGFAERVVVDRFKTQIFNPNTNQVRKDKKIADYKQDYEQPVTDSDRLMLKKRIAFLTSKAAMISVGYKTELELRQKGDRVEDAMHATYAAITEGIVAGGGTALLVASREFLKMNIPKKWEIPSNILADACVRPIRQILQNAGIDAEPIISKILNSKDKNYGYNVMTGTHCNMISAGIVDPLKVTKTALSNSVSVSSLILNTGAVLAESPTNPSDWQPPPGWRPPDGILNHEY